MSFALVAILKKPGEFDRPLTYKIPESMALECNVGQGVLVELRGKKVRGIIVELLEAFHRAESMKVLEISSVITELKLSSVAMALARNISDYYRCSLLRAIRLFLPKALWKGSGKRILDQFLKRDQSQINPDIFPIASFKHELTEEQKIILDGIEREERPILLQGITGSGKTEVYLRAILKKLRQGKQAILLVPEIALTPQIIGYFKDYFGDHLALFHSRLSEGQKLHEWLKVQSGYSRLVVGSRSAIFSPVRNLGIIIMDEEHEWTYKQESSPYYQTHKVAEMLCGLTGAQLILGSATPRLETYHLSQEGHYAHHKLLKRINDSQLPKVTVVDLRDEFKRKNFSIFSLALHSKIKDRLQKGEQIILFVNQRGMARAVVCRDCGQALMCPQCEVTLKLHGSTLKDQHLLCHYCAYRSDIILCCPHCQSVNIRHAGLGTERVEEEIRKTFPGVRVIRADKDTTSDKAGFEPLYKAFKNGEYDILVGTQMVAKGLDFPNVTLIGIMLADIGLHVPDFRSHERLFQLITQVAGRAGRGKAVGEVILQTYQPEHPAILMASTYEYDAFIEQELGFRRKLNYPPFCHLIKFTVTGTDMNQLEKDVEREQEILEDIFKVNKLPVTITSAPAMIPKIGPTYYYHVLLKSPDPHLIFSHWESPKGWRLDIDPVHTS